MPPPRRQTCIRNPRNSSTARRGAGPCPASPWPAARRDLPAGTIVDLPSVRYSNGQMEMRPADRATAALMGVVQPRAFEAFKAALLNDGDWRGLLHAFERSIPQNPVAAGEYRIAAGEFLKSTGYLLDLRA